MKDLDDVFEEVQRLCAEYDAQAGQCDSSEEGQILASAYLAHIRSMLAKYQE